jgi:hypothetical protein
LARAIWRGAIAFGLVNVPIRMYRAVEEHTLHFHYVHAPDGSRIGYEKICKKEVRTVPDEEIVKAFEFEKGEYVYLTDEDFQAAEAKEQHHTIDIRAFIPYEDIDPIYFERTYYLGPEEGGEASTRCSCVRWTTPVSPASASSSCEIGRTSPACASETASSRSSACTSPTRSVRRRGSPPRT